MVFNWVWTGACVTPAQLRPNNDIAAMSALCEVVYMG